MPATFRVGLPNAQQRQAILNTVLRYDGTYFSSCSLSGGEEAGSCQTLLLLLIIYVAHAHAYMNYET